MTDLQTQHDQLYRDTDLGHAEQLVEEHGDDFKYCPELGGWFAWTGIRWELDKSGEIDRRTYGMLKDNSMYALSCGNHEAAKKVIGTMNAYRIKSIIGLAANMERVRVRAEDFDRNPMLLTVTNGTLDLSTGELRDHDRNDRVTRWADVAYYPDATAPEWERFLERVLPDAELRSFVQRAVGYSMTADVSEQCMFINHGSGANGKSTFMGLIHAALGGYAMHTPVETLMAKRNGIPNDVARLKGQRFVTASESEVGDRLAESRVKEMTGQDTISARFMRAEWFDFEPTHKLWLSTNHKPKIRGTDEAIWRRIRLIPFDVTVPKEERDKKLPEKLRAELPGIFAWCVRGVLEWQRTGLREPKPVQSATDSYRADMDVLGAFITEECNEQPDARVGVSELYEAYKEWARRNEEFVKDSREFSTHMQERGYEKRKSAPNGSRQWHGIGLLVSSPF